MGKLFTYYTQTHKVPNNHPINGSYYSPLEGVHKTTTNTKLTEYFKYSDRKWSHNPN